jgi:hypothetical protein
MYAQCKKMQSLDPSREAWAVFGMVVQWAHEMGYHRDPDSLGSFSPFEGEMRRRFWALCKQVDPDGLLPARPTQQYLSREL